MSAPLSAHMEATKTTNALRYAMAETGRTAMSLLEEATGGDWTASDARVRQGLEQIRREAA